MSRAKALLEYLPVNDGTGPAVSVHSSGRGVVVEGGGLGGEREATSQVEF